MTRSIATDEQDVSEITASRKLEDSTLLFVGDMPPPMHGQARAFSESFNSVTCKSRILINQNFSADGTFSKLVKGIRVLLEYFVKITFRRIDIAYFTCSRTIFGGMRDVILVNYCKIFGVKMVNHIHGVGLKKIFSSSPVPIAWLFRKTYQRIDANIVLLDEMRTELDGVVPQSCVHVVPNFCEFDITDDQFECGRPQVHFLYLSNLIRSKGILELMDAFADIANRNDGVRLTIAGEFLGDEFMSKTEIQTEVQTRLRTHNNVPMEHVGVVSGTQKASLLCESDVFVLPSYYATEGFPFSIIEAMTSGNAIITTQHNLLPCIVKPENGFLAEKRSIDDLKRVMTQVIEMDRDDLKQIQMHNSAFAQDEYSRSKYVERIEQVLRSQC